jgi:RNA polymerase sigma-B factor
VALPPLLATLPAREQRILAMRFYGNLTQSQIASEMGISQMHVSRLITKALTSLRDQLFED